MKLRIPGSSVDPDAFADFYRFPEGRDEPAPLVIWAGGAISSESYEARRDQEPKPVVAELESARERLGGAPCDALLLSTPPTLQHFESSAELFRRFLAFEVFPMLPAPHPTTLGLVGNSFGAHLLTGFACRRGDARALAAIGGVGLWTAIEACGGQLPPQLEICCFANDLDFAGFFAYELVEELRARGRTIELVERAGDHPFSDYAANGSVADAFAFVLERVTVGRGSPAPAAQR